LDKKPEKYKSQAQKDWIAKNRPDLMDKFDDYSETKLPKRVRLKVKKPDGSVTYKVKKPGKAK
jgi:hypothetical protein